MLMHPKTSQPLDIPRMIRQIAGGDRSGAARTVGEKVALPRSPQERVEELAVGLVDEEGGVGREAFGRAAEPFEVANVIVFLASDYASYMTGEVVSVSSQHP